MKSHGTLSKIIEPPRNRFENLGTDFRGYGTDFRKTVHPVHLAYPPLKSPEHDLKWPIFGHFWPFLGQMFRISQNCTRPPEICTLPFIFVPSLFKNFLKWFNTFWNRSTCFSFEIIGAQYDFKSLRAVLKLLEQVQFWIYMCTKCHTCAPNVLPHEFMIFFVKMRFII